VRDSETVKIPTLPTKGSQFRAWKLTARQEILAASGVPRNEIIQWVMDVEKKTFAELADPGPHETLCTKIGAAVSKLAHGELGRKITLEIDNAARLEPPLVFAGRQALRLVYNYYVTDRACGAVDDYDDLQCVVWLGDAKMETFLDNWDHVMAGMEKEPPERGSPSRTSTGRSSSAGPSSLTSTSTTASKTARRRWRSYAVLWCGTSTSYDRKPPGSLSNRL